MSTPWDVALLRQDAMVDGQRRLVRHFEDEPSLAAITLACGGMYVTIRRTYDDEPETEPSTGFVWSVAYAGYRFDSIGADVWEPDCDPDMKCRRIFPTAESAYDDYLIQLERSVRESLREKRIVQTERAYMRPAEEAKLVRQVLKEAFPGVRFSVTSREYTGGGTVVVRWQDGPTRETVQALMEIFRSEKWETSLDRYVHFSHTLDGKPVAFLAGSVSCERNSGYRHDAPAEPRYAVALPSPTADRIVVVGTPGGAS